MALLEYLDSKMVYLDTAPIIYYIEDVVPYADVLEPVFRQIKSGTLQVCTSTLTLAETLVVPHRKKDRTLLTKFETLLTQTPDLTLLPLTTEIAKEAAKIRAEFAFKTPDAIQLATACVSGADYFLTNDKGLTNFLSIRVVVLDEIAAVPSP
ncbi:MAG: type II toxin-antitoxin system VapC family toxin [Planctomycetaceae bacterium]|jgi:predicted nucleic acid-binding protein|nr:type II toxin-antitoxin system VapC family toxin [Planctomycetaceae bacterium]